MGDVKEMGKAILSLIFNSKKRGVMGKKCREKIEEQYKLKIQAQRYLELYQELIDFYTSTAEATSEDHTSRVWQVPVPSKEMHLSVTLEPGVGSYFKDIYDQILFKALKELSCYVQKQWQASEADRGARLKVIEQLGEELEASELDRAALVELIQAHEKIFTGSLVGLLRYRRATKKRMNTQGENDASPRQWTDPQTLGVLTAETKGAKEDESFAVSVPGASSSQEIKNMSMKASGEKLPLISIVVPSFNQGRFLREALDSIFCQNYPRLEVILMDGGSTDESVDIIKKYAGNVTYWISEPDEGQSHAINKGFDNSTGDVVAWLNSDDFYLPGAFEAIARAYQENPVASFYFGDGWRVDEDGRSKGGFFPDHHMCFDRIGLIFGLNYILQPATFINRNYLSKAGFLNPSLRYGMDTDLWIRLSGITPPEPVSAFLAASREYGVTKTSKGSFERVEELRRIAQDYSGLSMTPGTMCYFLDTFHRVVSDREDVYPKSFKRQVEIFWGKTAKLMSNFGCRTDGFPMLSKPQGEKDKQ
jgi:glycosyltransferase involved in cell wall biosynthesis